MTTWFFLINSSFNSLGWPTSLQYINKHWRHKNGKTGIQIYQRFMPSSKRIIFPKIALGLKYDDYGNDVSNSQLNLKTSPIKTFKLKFEKISNQNIQT